MSPFTAGTPDSLESSVACWSTRNDPLTSGSRRPPVSTALLYPDLDTTTPRSHQVSNTPRFVLLRWWRGGVITPSTNKPILVAFVVLTLLTHGYNAVESTQERHREPTSAEDDSSGLAASVDALSLSDEQVANIGRE